MLANLWVEAIGYGFCTALLCAFCLFLLRAERRAREARDMRPYWTFLGLIATFVGLGVAYGVWRQLRPGWALTAALGIAGPCAVPLLLSSIVRLAKRLSRTRIVPERVAVPPGERTIAFTAFIVPASVQVLCALLFFLGALGCVLCVAIAALRAYLPIFAGALIVGALGCGASFLRVAYRIHMRPEGLRVEWRAGLFPPSRFECLWSDVTKVRMGVDAKQATFQLRSRQGWLECQSASTREAVRWYAALEEAAYDALGCSWRDGYIVFRSGGRVRGYPNLRRRERVRARRGASVAPQQT